MLCLGIHCHLEQEMYYMLNLRSLNCFLPFPGSCSVAPISLVKLLVAGTSRWLQIVARIAGLSLLFMKGFLLIG